MQVFRSIQDDDLVRGIGSATRRVVFLAPGVSAVVAKALESCLARHPRPQIMIVLDADEETCRLGYCAVRRNAQHGGHKTGHSSTAATRNTHRIADGR